MKFSTLSLCALGLQGATAATLRGDSKRDLQVLYYPRYTGDYATGWCTANDSFANGSPGYSTELACCNAAFASQTTGACYGMLPNPPTASPTGVDGPDAYYPNWDLDFAVGVCINTLPAPVGIQVYETELECCKGEYATQTSGACFAALPNPPTVSPTITGGPNAYYKDISLDFAAGVCINTMPAPVGAVIYDSELECCTAEYSTQTSGACLAALPNPPTVSPTITGGPDAYYADFDAGWATGTCINTMPAPSGRTIYDTELECCQKAYPGQTSGDCLAALPNPPTVSPTITGGPDAYYADRSVDWSTGVCINTMPAPVGAKVYDSELLCCKGEYASQTSGACLAALPNPPTVSPTITGGPDAYYADRSVDFAVGVCINTMPAPVGAKVYDSELLCCKGEYASQTSGACLAALPNPPTVSPTITGGPDAYYADRSVDWSTGVCINTMPAPVGAVVYDSELECCKGEYASQTSGACLAALPNPPTVSPTITGGPDAYYKAPDMDWSTGYCINTMPAPVGAVVYDSELECCTAAFAGQASGDCLAALPNPPTVSPTITGGPDAYYADRSVDWSAGVCINTMPAPVGAVVYDSQLECCKGEYASQSSGDCLAALPNPPTASPLSAANAKFFPIYSGWETGHCDNDPTQATAGGATYEYDTQAECCEAWFSGQTSGACMKFDPTYGSRSPTQAPIN